MAKIEDRFSFNENTRTLTIDGVEKRLTTKEGGLFAFLYRNKNEVSDRDEVLQEVWENTSYFSGRSMDVYITKLRKLIEPLNPNVYIENVHGKGYKLIIQEDENE